jgi:aminopeptidase 2
LAPLLIHVQLPKQIGFPVVSAKLHNDNLSLRQDRFLATGDPTEEENQTLWHIPLGLLTVSDDDKVSVDWHAVLSERESTIDLDGAELFKLNLGTTGVYRVAYEPSYLDTLGMEAGKKDSLLSPKDRVGLVSDAHQLSRSVDSIPSFLELGNIRS